MKNSKKIKEILIDMAIESTLPSDMNELDDTIFNFCNVTEDTKDIQDRLQRLWNSCEEGQDETWDVTTSEGREGFGAMQDSITEIAKQLGMDVSEYQDGML